MSNRVSYEEQIESGLVRRPKNNLVLPTRPSESLRRLPSELNTVSHVIDVQPSAVMTVEMRTSAVDRTKGFLWANVPLFAVIALCAVLVSSYMRDVPLWSLGALVIFALTFAGAWLASYIYTLTISPEGVAYYESKQKWQVIKREQRERWNYYNRLDGK